MNGPAAFFSMIEETAKTAIQSVRDVFAKGADCTRCHAIWIISIVLIIAGIRLDAPSLEKLLFVVATGALTMLGVGGGSKARGQGPEAPAVDPNASRM